MLFKKIIFLFLVCLLISPGGVFAKTVSGTITMEFNLSNHDRAQEVKLWIPYPVSDQYQLITNVKVKGDFIESAIYTDRIYKTPILFARWNKNVSGRHLVLTFTAERKEVIRKDFPAKEAAWSPDDYKKWLAPTSLGPVTGAVKKLADKITAGKVTVYDKAKSIYDWTCENMYRDPNTRGCGFGNVLLLLKKPGGKCTDINSTFVALCRAAGVPARAIFGIRMGKKPVQDITKWQHCWAEFYLPGYGWVPVDPADVRKMMLKHNLKLDDPETVQYRKYFWGAWDPYRVQLSIGRDLMLNPPQEGVPLNDFGYPYAEVGNKTLDWLDPATFSYKITYTQI